MSLKSLYLSLKRDKWRRERRFSDDIATVNDVLFDTYATDGERKEQLLNWLQRFQPCIFGRVAAASNGLHVCLLTGEDFLLRSDRQIRGKIQSELLDWKRRSVQPTTGFSSPAHGFVLATVSDRLANAAPDEHLYSFACKLQEVWGCPATEERSGTVHWETLYLQNPLDNSYVQFTFGVDFFAAQGDGRWWHDHRCPGGLLFTANSVGHMRRHREWYLKMKNQEDWILQTAMLTIHEAADTPYGKATWLKELGPGRQPLLRDMACPFSKPEAVKRQLADKDWTRYAGYLHTDHSIRHEFFHENPEPIQDIKAREYLQDFTYLYDENARDHRRFVSGTNVAREEIEQKLGPMAEWNTVVSMRRRDAKRGKGAETPQPDVSSARRRVEELLEKGRSWRLSDEEINSLD
jgi:hypothetical protein